MAIAWVQGTTFQAPEGGPGTPITVTINGVTPGNCLIVSVGSRTNTTLYSGLMHLIDDKDNIWFAPTTSPAQLSASEGAGFQLFTFVSVRQVGGDTTITFYETEHFGAYAISIDEYSGVGAAFPMDQASFGSTIYGSGLQSVSSGNISAPSGQLVYSVAFGMVSPLTLTPSAGFTQRQHVTGVADYPISLTSWDKTSSGGNYSNIVTVPADPNTLHVNILGLSPTDITRPLVQYHAYSLSGVDVEAVSATYPYPNTGGNLLIATGQQYERQLVEISDTQDNDWRVVYDDPIGGNPTIILAYCLSCKDGPNTVTMTSLNGGTDDDMLLVIAESEPQTAFTSSANSGQRMFEESVNTGNVEANVASLLVSAESSYAINNLDKTAPGPVSQLGTVIYQFSVTGHYEEQVNQLVLAYQSVSSPGVYNNIFSISPDSADFAAGILGFSNVPSPNNCFLTTFPLLGPYFDPNGQVLSNGSLLVRLVFDCNCPCADYQITGNNHVSISLDENGMVIGSPQVRPNDQLKPDNSYYILQAYSNAGQLVLGPKVVKILST